MNEFIQQWLTPGDLTVFWTIMLIIASMFTSALTAALGIGGGVSLMTIMLNVLPPAIVLPIHGVVQLGSNGGRALIMREHIHRPIIGWLAIGTVIGIVIASFIFFALPTKALKIILALFILWSLWTPKFKASAIPEWGFLGVGALAAFATMFVGATGTLLGAFWDHERLGKMGVVGTHAASMTIQHGLKVVAFGFLGFSFREWLPLVLAMVASGFVGTILGKRILSWLPEKSFKILFKLTLSGFALRLLWTALVE